MNVQIKQAVKRDVQQLVMLRIDSMKESLQAVGRFDPHRAMSRFLNGFSHEHTWKIIVGNKLVGFYVYKTSEKCLYLEHLYIHPDFQGNGLGSDIIKLVKKKAHKNGLVIQVGALRDSKSNDFYQKHGFVKIAEELWDIYYEYSH